MNAHNPPHWTLNYRFGGFHTIWLHSGPFDCLTSPKLHATKSHLYFSQRTHPIYAIGPETDVLGRFVLFVCIRSRLVALRN